MTNLLLDTDLTHRQREFVETARRSGESLVEIINEILDFSKIEAGKLELESIPFELWSETEEAFALFAGAADKKGLDLLCRINPDVPQIAMGDPTRLRQVVMNLTSNALKFTAQGRITMHVSIAESSDDPLVRVSVTDTGCGIEPEAQARLFDSFTQANSSTTRKFGGTGLGLAITKRLAEAMGGKITIRSEPGRGSTFTATLRLGVASTAVPEPRIEGRALVLMSPEAPGRTDGQRASLRLGPPSHDL